MKTVKLIITLTLIILLKNHSCSSTFSKTDSLLTRLHQSLHDTDRVNTLNALGWELMYSNPDTAIILGNQALMTAEKSQWKKGIANSLGQLGVYHWLKSDYPKALEYYFKALKINENLNDRKGISATLGNIGGVYSSQSDYPKALDYYFKALKMDEELGDKNGIAVDLGNIGIVYDDQADYPKALDYYFRSLKIKEELGNKSGIAATLGNIGSVYYEQGDYPKALDYYLRALKMAEELGNKKGIAAWLSGIGIVYDVQGDYPKALDYYFKALKMDEELGNNNDIARHLGNIGSLYTKTGRFAEAETYLDSALVLFDSIGALYYTMQFEEAITHLYDTLGQLAIGNWQSAKYYQLAYEHYKKYSTAKDTIFNQEKEKDITRKEMNYEFEKKEAAAKAGQDKKDAVATVEKRRQKIIIYAISAGLFLVLLLALFIFRGYKQKQKANLLLGEKNKIIEKKNEDITQKNKDITDSIRYAERIQHAILTPKTVIDKIFENYFILYKPKDIVSGDFYFFAEVGAYKIAIAADCTGHGVPGAFMSMIGNDMLNAIINDKNVTSAAMVLNELNKAIQRAVNIGKGEEDIKDGMDIAACVFNTKTKKLQYSGANNPLYIVRNGGSEISVISGDKQPIGYWHGEDKPFTNHDIKLQKGDTIYITSDGYQDQFGGPKGKKFMSKQLRNLFSEVSAMSMEEQKEHLNKTIEEWKAGRVQTDDICVIGLRL